MPVYEQKHNYKNYTNKQSKSQRGIYAINFLFTRLSMILTSWSLVWTHRDRSFHLWLKLIAFLCGGEMAQLNALGCSQSFFSETLILLSSTKFKEHQRMMSVNLSGFAFQDVFQLAVSMEELAVNENRTPYLLKWWCHRVEQEKFLRIHSVIAQYAFSGNIGSSYPKIYSLVAYRTFLSQVFWQPLPNITQRPSLWWGG